MGSSTTICPETQYSWKKWLKFGPIPFLGSLKGDCALAYVLQCKIINHN